MQARRGGPQRLDQLGRDPQREREHGAREHAERQQPEPAAADRRAGAEQRGDARLGGARRPHRAGRDRPQAAEAGSGAGEPGDDERQPGAVEREREQPGRGVPALAGRLEAALRARAAHHRGARLVREDREQREEHEGAEGQRDATHQFTLCIGRCGPDQEARSMSARRSRAKRASERLSESRSARRMKSASVSGVSALRSLSSYSSSSVDLDRVGRGREPDPLGAAELLVLHLERLPDARLVGADALDHPPAAAGLRVPHRARADRRPLALELLQVAEAVDPRRPALRVVPDRLRLGGEARDLLDGAHAWHRAPVSLPSRRCSPSGR